MRKTLVVQPIHPLALQLLESRPDVAFEVLTDASERNLLERVSDAEAIIVRDASLSEAVLAGAPRLCVVSRHGVGYDNIPVAHCTGRNIPVTIVGPVNAVAVAEHTMFLILAAARMGVLLDGAVREGRFSARSEVLSVELQGRTLTLIGFGNIGREVARRAQAFGLRICVYDPFTTADLGPEVARASSLDEALARADILSLHVPLTEATRGMIGARELALLPGNAIVVNASRGGIVDEEALLDAVDSGRLHGAGLDTFETEPLPASSPLVGNRRIVLSPHSAALTEDALIAMGVRAVQNALDGLDGRLDPQLVVNPQTIGAAR